MFSFAALAEALLIVVALSTDAFVSGFAYGSNKIKIPFSSVTIINVICSAILALSLFFGNLLNQWLPTQFATALCVLLLLGLGLAKLFDSVIKAFIRRHNAYEKKIRFSAFHFGFILNIYANPENADRDHSRVLSATEAAYLAVALSLDGLAVGFGAGIANTSPLLVVFLSLFTDMFAILLGCRLGNRVSRKLNLDLSWLSGALLIILAILKLP